MLFPLYCDVDFPYISPQLMWISPQLMWVSPVAVADWQRLRCQFLGRLALLPASNSWSSTRFFPQVWEPPPSCTHARCTHATSAMHKKWENDARSGCRKSIIQIDAVIFTKSGNSHFFANLPPKMFFSSKFMPMPPEDKIVSKLMQKVHSQCNINENYLTQMMHMSSTNLVDCQNDPTVSCSLFFLCVGILLQCVNIRCS